MAVIYSKGWLQISIGLGTVACETKVAAHSAHGFKLVRAAERHWRRLNGFAYLPEVIEGVCFHDSIGVRDDGPAQTDSAAA